MDQIDCIHFGTPFQSNFCLKSICEFCESNKKRKENRLIIDSKILFIPLKLNKYPERISNIKQSIEYIKQNQSKYTSNERHDLIFRIGDLIDFMRIELKSYDKHQSVYACIFWNENMRKLNGLWNDLKVFFKDGLLKASTIL